MLTCPGCTQTFEQKRLGQRNCSKECALKASKKLWGKFVYPYTKRSKEEGLVGNMVQIWPKSSHGQRYAVVVRKETLTVREKIIRLKPKVEVSGDTVDGIERRQDA